MMYHKIIEELKKYDSGAASEKDLERWMISSYQQVLASGEEPAVMLANEIDSLFVEQSEGLVSEAEVHYTLTEILRREESSVSLQLGQNSIRPTAVKSVRKRLRTAGQVTDVHLTFQGV